MIKAKNILLVRTDRIGELLLTAPAFRAVRKFMPAAKITAIVDSASAEVVEGCPFVDFIIKISPGDLKRSFIKRLKLLIEIEKLKCDIAIVFNPTKLFHVLTFLAGIPRRLGYNRKFGFLLTDKIEDRKYLGEKHEIEHNLELINSIGIPSDEKAPFFQSGSLDEKGIEKVLKKIGIERNRPLVAVHPATSNPEKMWPLERFAKLCDMLIDEFKLSVILVGGTEEKDISEEVKSKVSNLVFDLTGALTIKELGALLRKCRFLISNDSGPVHIAAALNVPTFVFFGESRPGGGSKRWAPFGEGHTIFARPKVTDITVEEVFKAISEKLNTL